MNIEARTSVPVSYKLSFGLSVGLFLLALMPFTIISMPYAGGIPAFSIVTFCMLALIFCLTCVGSVRRLEREIHKAQASDQAKTQLLANTRHELSTPMSGIIGIIGLLQRTDLDDSQREMIELISDSAASQTALIHDLTDGLDGVTAVASIEPAFFDPIQAVRSVFRLFEENARQKNVNILLDIQSDPAIAVLGNLKAFRQIVSNLIGNAVKFTDLGQIDVCIKMRRQAENLIWLQLEVIDTGPGIPADQLSDVFERAFRVDVGHANMKEGSGLGLAICKSLAEAMGGDIVLKSDFGKGARFTFSANFEEYQMEQAV